MHEVKTEEEKKENRHRPNTKAKNCLPQFSTVLLYTKSWVNIVKYPGKLFWTLSDLRNGTSGSLVSPTGSSW